MRSSLLFVASIGALYAAPAALRAQAPDTVLLGGPDWGDEPRLVEEVRIGSLMGDVEYALGYVGGVAVLPSGEVWVSDSRAHLIRRYDVGGVFIGNVGREGEGPGEFRDPGPVRTLPDGSVVVWDPGLLRLSRFDTGGRFLDSFRPPTIMIGGPNVFEVDREGRIYLMEITRSGPAPAAALTASWIRMRSDGPVLDSVPIEPTDPEGNTDAVRTSTAMSPLGYRVVGRSDRYALRFERPEGAVVLERPIPPVRYQRAERAYQQDREKMFHERTGRPERRVPETKPYFFSFYPDGSGRIWIAVYDEGFATTETEGEKEARERACKFFGASEAECDRGIERWAQPSTFDVVHPDGRFLGRLRFPNPRTRFAQARGPHVWVVEEGEFGEPYVVRYRIDSGT